MGKLTELLKANIGDTAKVEPLRQEILLIMIEMLRRLKNHGLSYDEGINEVKKEL